MGPEVVNRNKDSIFHGNYAGRDLNVTNIIMQEDSEREFVVTRNANIRPVAYFTGRETELDDLRQRIGEKRKSVLVSGMGGIGKTHICRKLFEEYSNLHAEDENIPFRHIGYIEYDGDMGSSLQGCLKYKEQDSPEKNREAAWRELEYLAADGKLLLFVDNVNKSMREDDGLKRLNTIPGAIVLTSRQASFGGEFEAYRLGFLSKEECVEIYEKIRFENSGRKVKPDEVPDLEYVIETLAGRHTITVEHLAHLAWTKHWPVKRLRKELEEKGFCLEFHKDGELVNIQKSYEILYDLSELTEAEQNILEAFSVFPYIPLAVETCNEWLLADAGVDEDADILTGLYQKGWLQFDIEQDNYALHPVYAQFIHEKCKPSVEEHLDLISTCKENLKILEKGFKLQLLDYAPFIESIILKIKMRRDMEQAEIMHDFAYVMEHISDYSKAEKWYEMSVKVYENVYGENGLKTATGYVNLANIYMNRKKYKMAERLYKKGLWICKSVLGDNHLDIAKGYENLAECYNKQNEYEKAIESCKKSLQIYESLQEDNSLQIACIHIILAEICEKRGEYKKMKELHKKSQKILSGMEKVDSYHICKYAYLGALYFRQGKYNKAEINFEKNLKIIINVFGERDPETATAYKFLGMAYERQGKFKEAENLYKKSVEIRERVLGEEHPDTAESYDKLAGTYRKQGEQNKAKKMCEKSLRIRGKALGEEHPDTAISYYNLAEIYGHMGEYNKARELYEKSLRIREKVLGENHPDTAMSYENLAGGYEAQGEYEKAMIYYFKAYKTFVLWFGLKHPDSRTVYGNMELTFKEWNPEDNFEQWLEEKMKE